MSRLLRSLLYLFLLGTATVQAQTNMVSTSVLAKDIMQGNYNPSTYKASVVINKPDDIVQGLMTRISPDSLHAYLNVLATFGTRNTGSDTVSATHGIGAARRWAYSKFQQFSAQNENRLIPSYLQFEQTICGIDLHRNTFAVLPGMDTSDRSVVIIEAHLDSRCEGSCDTACIAQGMEDNGSGTALVLELARIMSKYSYNHTIVFVLTTSEEQGLNGAQAFAKYCVQEGIEVKGVLNNDVVGGIICGQTASPPGCMGAGSIDSTNLRLFSFGGFNSQHKQLTRFVKLEYRENVKQKAAVPMDINIMTPEDRTGRGGDHIPFRQRGFTAIRFCAANENGDADVNNPNYKDRQHTSTDILGVDTDNDMIIDSFFVDFNYLSRMTVINGNAAAMMAIGPKTPTFAATTNVGQDGAWVTITSQTGYPQYRVAVRTTTNDWDTVYTMTGKTTDYIPITGIGTTYILSVASVDAEGVESLFSEEQYATVDVSDTSPEYNSDIELLQNRPNPFDGQTILSVIAGKTMAGKKAAIVIYDISGKEIERLNLNLHEGMNEVMYEHGYGVRGTYSYTLVVDGDAVQTKRMIFAN